MITQGQLSGVVGYYNPVRKYGYIERKVAAPTGYFVERFFLAPSQVVYCGVQEISVGCFARFEKSTRAPKRPDDFPFAIRIYIFESEQQAQAIDELVKVAASVGCNNENP